MSERNVKLLLLLLNRRGIDVNWERKTSYSEQFNTMTSSHTLKFWYKGIRKNKKTGEDEQYSYCVTKEFRNMIGMLKYLVAIKDNKIKAGEEHEEE